MPNKEKDKDVVKGWIGLRGGSGQVLACLVRWACLERFFLAVCPALFGRNVLTGLPVLLGVAALVCRGGRCLHQCQGIPPGLLCVDYVSKIDLNKSAFLLIYAQK